MAVEIDETVGNCIGERMIGLLTADPPGKGKFVSCHSLFYEDVMTFGEDDPAGRLIDQDPEGYCLKKHDSVSVYDAEISGKIQMHRLARPGEKSDLLVIFRKPVKDCAVLRNSPQKSLIQRLVPGHPQIDRVRDRRLLKTREQRGQAQFAGHIHIRGEDLEILSVYLHNQNLRLIRLSKAFTTSPKVDILDHCLCGILTSNLASSRQMIIVKPMESMAVSVLITVSS